MFLKNADKNRQVIVENENFTRFINEKIDEKIVFNINDIDFNATYNISLVFSFSNN